MSIWQTHATPAEIDALCRGTLVSHLGIRFLEVGEDFLSASMPVDATTIQPAGLLHGGASVALAESLGSVAAQLCIDAGHKRCLGLEVNANHLRPVPAGGQVVGVARPLHLGQRTQVWEVRVSDSTDHLVCISRLTLAVVDVPR